MKQLIFSLPFLIAILGCSNESRQVYGVNKRPPVEVPQPKAMPTPFPKPTPVTYPTVPRDELKWVKVVDPNSPMEFNPQVDILFVIDNSDSMKSAQENLSRNINQFVRDFVQNRIIDFQIGVISVWDSSDRFVKSKQDKYGKGELRALKDGAGKTLDGKIVRRFDRLNEILAATLKIGVAPLSQGGPETEEVFSPLSEALRKSATENREFFRANAQLVVVVITDADDSTPSMSPDQMAQELFDFKGGHKEKVSAYGVLVRPNDSDEVKDWGLRIHPKYHPECFDDQGKRKGEVCQSGFGPDRIDEFLVLANQAHGNKTEVLKKNILKLAQKDFGPDLALIGSDISRKTLAHEIFLPSRPSLDPNQNLNIRVRYGTPEQLSKGSAQVIPQKKSGGWTFDPERNSLKFAGDIQYQYSPNARFEVEMIPLRY